MRIPTNPAATPPPLEYYVEARDGFTGDVATDLAVMLIDYVRESRHIEQQQTRAETAQLRLAHAAQIKDMRDEADKIRDAGWIKGAGLVTSGLLSVGSGFATASTASNTSTASTASNTSTASTASNTSTASATNAGAAPQKGIDWPTVLKGGGDAAQGGSELWAAHVDRQGALARTRATKHEHQAGESERRLDALDEARAHFKELEQSALEHLRSVQETRADTERASITWRG